MTLFNLDDQNANLDNKIVAGLERLSQAFRILLWEKAKEFELSPVQIQLLIFIRQHTPDKNTVSYLAQEFNLTRPTISDAIKVLEQKKMIQKVADRIDSRSYTIQLTALGRRLVQETENFADPISGIIADAKESDKLVLWKNISTMIVKLNKLKIISVQRTCYNCAHYSVKSKSPFCNLLDHRLLPQDIRLDCREFEQA